MNQKLVIIDENVPLADSRQIAEDLEIGHHDFYNNLIKKYQGEIEEDFGQVRFENAPLSSGQKQKYALLTEDQSYAYMSYSKNTEQARRCKRLLVKAFAEARRQIAQLKEQLGTPTQGWPEMNPFEFMSFIAGGKR